MPRNAADPGDQSQLDKFKAAARALEADDDDDRFKERVRKLVKHKPVESADENAAGPPANESGPAD